MARILFLFFFLCSCMWGCVYSPTQSPEIHPLSLPIERNGLGYLSSAKVNYLNISPDENTTLIDGHHYKFKVDIAMSGPIQNKSEWEMRVIFDNLKSPPFLLSTLGGGGTFDVSSTLIWKVPVSGKSESVQVEVYSITRSNTGKTTYKTLTRSMQRSYNVVCDRNALFIVLIIKKFFSLCNA